MPNHEYKVVPAPQRGEKARGVKSTADRFALALTNLMNIQAREGWEYLRADTLPCDERVGLTGTKTTFQNMLVFRRVLAEGGSAVVVPTEVEVIPRLGAATAAPEGAAPVLGPAVAPVSDVTTTGIAAE
jgi:hypothetical protein